MTYLVFGALPLLFLIIGLFNKNPVIRKTSISLLSLAALILAWILSMVTGLLFTVFGEAETWLPVMLAAALYALILLLVWRPFDKKKRVIIGISIASALVLVAGIYVAIGISGRF